MASKPKRIRRQVEEVNSSSMADIAFLLLIFFLVTTTILNEKGLNFILPAKKEKQEEIVKQKERNVYTVMLNSQNKLLVQNQPVEIEVLKEKTIEFLDNKGKKANLSESPDKAIISFKTDRGTDFKTYMDVLDALKSAYTELRAQYVNLTPEEYLRLDPADPEDNVLMQHALAAYPQTLSEAEPSDFH